MNYIKRNWFLLLLIILLSGYTAYTSYLVLSNDNQKVIEEQQKQISLLSDKTGRVALITLLEKAAEGIEGKTGTRVQM